MIPTEDDLRAAYRTPLDEAALNRLRASIGELAELEPAVRGRRSRPSGRWLVPAIAAAVVVAVFVAIAVSGGGHRPVGKPGPADAGLARPDSPAALRLWAGFPVTASPRPLVLTGQAIIDPAGGFANGDDKMAYIYGNFDLRTTLPAGPSTASGQRIVSAAQALADLRATGSDGKQAPTSLAITEVKLGTATFSTDRGARSLPAWSFRFATVADPALVLAIPAADRWPRPGMPTGNGDQIGATVSSDGTRVTLTFVGAAAGSGPCDAEYTADVKQSATAVAISVREQRSKASLPAPTDGAGVGCDAMGHTRTVTVTLQPPLGNRVLIDSRGVPLPMNAPLPMK